MDQQNRNALTPAELETLRYVWHNRITAQDHAPEWDDFDTFVEFIEAQGWRPGMNICRVLPDEPWCPENTRIGRGWSTGEQESIRNWDATVAKIRKAHGLPPLTRETSDNYFRN